MLHEQHGIVLGRHPNLALAGDIARRRDDTGHGMTDLAGPKSPVRR